MARGFLKDPEPGKPKKYTQQVKTKRKNATYLDEESNFYCMSDGKIADSYKERKGNEYIAFLLANKDVITIRPFWISQGINPEVAEDWTKTNEKFKLLWQFAKQIIGDRREHGALKRDLSEKIHLLTASYYLKEYKDLEEWREAIKAKDNNNNEPLKILIEKFTTKD